jgi:glycine cleavage system H protein
MIEKNTQTTTPFEERSGTTESYESPRSSTWTKVDGSLVIIGISSETLQELGDVAWVRLPKIGDRIEKEGLLTVLESTKAAFDIESPIAGRVERVNIALEQHPELLQSCRAVNAYETSWICAVRQDSVC